MFIVLYSLSCYSNPTFYLTPSCVSLPTWTPLKCHININTFQSVTEMDKFMLNVRDRNKLRKAYSPVNEKVVWRTIKLKIWQNYSKPLK